MNEQSAEAELDGLQAAYKAAMEEWIVAIQKEVALVSVTPHSVAEVDNWEGAHFEEDEARNKVLEAKEAYEGVLRRNAGSSSTFSASRFARRD